MPDPTPTAVTTGSIPAALRPVKVLPAKHDPVRRSAAAVAAHMNKRHRSK